MMEKAIAYSVEIIGFRVTGENNLSGRFKKNKSVENYSKTF